jgi:hypothetical protein
MANKSEQQFGKRKPVSVPASQRPGSPPAKRSGHVALLLMGTVAVGGAAYALMPNRDCEPSPNAASSSLQQNNANCSSSSSSGGSSSRSSYSSSNSSSSHSSSGTSDSGSHSAQRGGFGSFGHAVGFSGG